MQYFQSEKYVFVSDLFWHPLDEENNSKKRKELIRNIADEQSCDLIVIRNAKIPQVGFASTHNGMQKGMVSIAALIADAFEKEGIENFLYAGQAEANFWVCVGVYEGMIIVDKLGSDAQINALFHEQFTQTSWKNFYAPAHWDFANATEKTFDELLPKKGKRLAVPRALALRPVTTRVLSKRNLALAMGVCGLFWGAYKGLFYWKAYQEAEELEKQMALEAEIRQKNSPPPEHPWKKLPRASDMVNACGQALGNRRVWAGNWFLGDMQCSRDFLTLTWTRKNHGWINQIKTLEPDAIVSPEGNTASLSVALQPETGSDETVPDREKREQEMRNKAQFYGFNLSLKPIAIPAPSDGQPATVRNWHEIEWRLQDIRFRPETIINIFDAPGFRVNAIKTAIQENGSITWSMEGTQYVK